MGVAKPLLEYVNRIKVKTDIRGSGKEFKTLLRFHRHYIHLFAVVILLSVLRSYLFTLEPFYTSQIIDKVIVAGHYDLLADLVFKIIVAVVGVEMVVLAISFVNGYAAELMKIGGHYGSFYRTQFKEEEGLEQD